ncbi:hypothetical protein L1987_63986 [Smallanthus sonchifolius]|uniref:Uncharacterized protein n=1 Tax=Smallanthus sonchifolius TaxID=185202 RepID=A0ACB9CEU3_9ASTR|nr:hypothetical protein L1987_63986 [Smallanthus sonchifolius]
MTGNVSIIILFDSRISRASEFVGNLMTEAGSDSIRGPGLANLEIERRKIIFGKGNADKFMEDLILYFSRFGHLASFTADVEVFLQVLPCDMKKQFLERLVKCIKSSSTPSRHVLGQNTTFLKIQELIGDMFSLPIGDLVGFAVQMTEMYCQNLPLSKDLDAQESMYGEELLSMTCNVLVQIFFLAYPTCWLSVGSYNGVGACYVWQYKILLLHLSFYWNAVPLAYEWYKSLDVKNILLETVSHHIFPQMLTSSLLVDISDVLKGYLRFMDDHFRESADLTFLAYRHRNYSKVIEFVQFKERLQQSCQYLTAKVEDSILQLKRKANSIEEAELLLLHNFFAGPYEDVSCYPRENLDVTKQTEAKVISIGKRSLLPRMIYLSIQWFPFTDALLLFPMVRNLLSSEGHAFPINWQVLCSLLEQCISKRINSTKPLLSTPGTDLSSLVQLVTEPLSWLGLIIQSCVRSSLPSGKKKKKGGHSDLSNNELPNAVKDSISSLFSMMDVITKWLKEQTDKPVGERINRAVGSWKPVDVAQKIVTAQRTALTEFLNICESKTKGLKALKL